MPEPSTTSPPTDGTRRRPRALALDIVDAMVGRIREGAMAVGDKLPTEAAIMESFGVSRTVVREALSKLQAGGLVETRHGIGTFVVATGNSDEATFRVGPEQIATVREVVAVLELRIGLEVEAAALAALRRSPRNLEVMRAAVAAFGEAVANDADALGADLQLHQEIAAATQNAHFVELMRHLSSVLIPRARINTARVAGQGRREYLSRVHAEHESIVDAIANHDADAARAAMRTHLSNSRERLRRAEPAPN